MKQSFCGRMPFLSPTSSNHSLDLILSLTTKTPEQERDVTPFTSAIRRQYPQKSFELNLLLQFELNWIYCFTHINVCETGKSFLSHKRLYEWSSKFNSSNSILWKAVYPLPAAAYCAIYFGIRQTVSRHTRHNWIYPIPEPHSTRWKGCRTPIS